MTAARSGAARIPPARPRLHAGGRGLLAALGLAGALAAATPAQAHPDGNGPADAPTSVSVDFATGLAIIADDDWPHCYDTVKLDYRYSSTATWTTPGGG